MSYFDGFVLAVPTDRKDDFIAHARAADSLFIEQGALRVVECWADDVPHGKQTDFYRSVAVKEGESIVFSWIEWPDKATRDDVMGRMEEIMADDRMNPEKNPMPFDGSRMIFGGFSPVVDLRKD